MGKRRDLDDQYDDRDDSGVSIDSSGDVGIGLGNGLSIDTDGDIGFDLGGGLTIDTDGDIGFKLF